MKNKKHKIPVRVSIHSRICDLTGDSDEMPDVMMMMMRPPEAEVETIDYNTDGELSDDGETVTVKYDESAEMGFEQSSTSLSFNKTAPGTVMMVRSGDGSAAFRFDASEKRQHCVYETGIMPIELIINTHSVENTVIGSGGRISLDYSIELRGMTTERNLLSLHIRPIMTGAVSDTLSDVMPKE